MPTLSLIQILPSHVVNLIVDHVAGNSRLRFDGIKKDSQEYAVLLLPLLSVCRDFREAVLARYFRLYNLDLTCISDKGNDKKTLWPACLRHIEFPTHLYAKELELSLNAYSVYSGAALKELMCASRIDLIFPMVRSLKIWMPPTTREQRLRASVPAAHDIEPNIVAFVQRIKSMTPVARRVIVSHISGHANTSQFAVQHFSSLVAHLNGLGNVIDHHYHFRPMPMVPLPTGIHHLVHMDYRDEGGELAMQLARHNAPTLLTMTMELGENDSIDHLIQNADGSYAQYTRLHTLKIVHYQYLWLMEQGYQPSLAFPGAIPFPGIRRLHLGGCYPFGDDTPFRGNAPMLEYLHLHMFAGIIAIVKEHKVFTPASHPRLQHIKVVPRAINVGDVFGTVVDYMQFVLSIGSNASVREVDQLLTGPGFQSLIPILGEYTSIHTLVLSWTSLSLWDVIALVKALPLLSSLCTGTPILDPQPRGVLKHRLPEYVVANYAPIGERLRCLKLGPCSAPSMGNIVRCVLLLALVCPKLDYAAVPGNDRDLFMAYMKKMVSTDGFRPHATRLRRLLFGGCKGMIPSVKAILAKKAVAKDSLTC